MFESSVVPPAPRGRRSWTLSVSTALQVALVAGAVVFPLLKVEALPPVKLVPRPPAPRFRSVEVVAVSRAVAQAAVSAPRLSPPRRFTAPPRVPDRVDMTADLASQPATMPDERGALAPNAGPGLGDPVRTPVIVPPPPKPPVTAAAPVERPKPVPVGGVVRPPRLIREVRPPYPPIARQARVQGAVRLQAVLSRDGSVQSLQLLSGPPLLVKAALDAVSQWRYEPTLLNGQPVEVLLMVDVNFTLSQ